jgi:hypothetical protein
MFWASPAWWTGTPGVVAILKVAYNTVARWITGLPLNTRTTNLITLAHLPPMEVYLDYLSLRYAIRLHFLPTHHVLGPPREQPNTHANLPGLHRLYNLSKNLVRGKLEDRTATITTGGVAKTVSPNPDKMTQPQQLHEKWLETLADHTIVILSRSYFPVRVLDRQRSSSFSATARRSYALLLSSASRRSEVARGRWGIARF